MTPPDELAVGRMVEGTTPAIDSSSVVLVRDGECGLEVCMLERHIETDFAGGALVFPGGKVEEGDRRLDPDRWTGVALPRAVEELGAESEPDALGLLVAAVRETFEEAGVLFATRDGDASAPDALGDDVFGGGVLGDDVLGSESFREARRRLTERDTDWDWREWLATERLVLRLDRLALFSWWATPDGLHRRYDTRFFVAAAPEEQLRSLAHDEVETMSSRWIRPAEALSLGRRRAATVVFPTRKNLEALATYATADELVAAAQAGKTDRRRLQPRIVEVDGRKLVQHPDGGPPEPG